MLASDYGVKEITLHFADERRGFGYSHGWGNSLGMGIVGYVKYPVPATKKILRLSKSVFILNNKLQSIKDSLDKSSFYINGKA